MTSHAGVYSAFEVGDDGGPTDKMIGYLYYTGPDMDVCSNTPARLMRATLPYNATISNIVKFGIWCLVDFSVSDFPVIMIFHNFGGCGQWESAYLKRLSCEPRESDRRNVRRVEL